MKHYFRTVFYLILIIGLSCAKAGAYEDFFIAINRDDDRAVAQLLGRGFDPNSRDPKGQTGFILAMRDESPRVAGHFRRGHLPRAGWPIRRSDQAAPSLPAKPSQSSAATK